MTSKITVIVNESGVHARPASTFVTEAKKFKSRVTIRNLHPEDEENASGSAKSILTVLALSLAKGSEVEISADGEDEDDAVAALVSLIEAGLGE